MELSDVYLVTNRLKRVPASSLDALEKSVAMPLPLGYREYLTRFGIGRFSGFLTVKSPQQVKKQLAYWRDSELGAEVVVDGMNVGLYSSRVLSAKKVRESCQFATTDNGDVFVSTPSCGKLLFVILDGGPSIRNLRHGFLDPMACCRAVGATDRRAWFEAGNGRRRSHSFRIQCGVSAIEDVVKEMWQQKEIRRFEIVDYGASGSVATYGIRAIDGLLQVSSNPHGKHAHLSYDQAFADEVKSFANFVGRSKRGK